MMTKTMMIAAAALTLLAGAAQAQTVSRDIYAPGLGRDVVANSVVGDTGSESVPQFGSRVTVVTQGVLLPTNGAEGIVETANSVPLDGATRMALFASAYAAPQAVMQGVLLPTNGAEGIVQTANSLPVGWTR